MVRFPGGMQLLSSKERLRRCFFYEPIDRPGVYCRPSMPPDDPTYDPLRRLLDERSDLKFLWSAGLMVPAPAMTTSREHYSDEFAREIDRMETPKGELLRTRLVGLKNQPGMVEKHFITDRQEAERYLSMPDPEIGGETASFFDLQRQAGDRGITVVYLGTNPAGQVACLMGSDHFATMSITDRDIIHEICQRQMKVMLDIVDYLLAHDVGPLFQILGQEYVVPPLHGPADFDDFNVRYDKPIFDRIHSAGGRIHVHCHGPISKVLDGFLEMDVDVLHPFEPPPMGDIEASEAKQRVRGRMCIEGNIQISDMYEKSPDEIREQTRRLIADAFDDGCGLIVCPSASPYIPREGGRCLEQFRTMIETVEQWH